MEGGSNGTSFFDLQSYNAVLKRCDTLRKQLSSAESVQADLQALLSRQAAVSQKKIQVLEVKVIGAETEVSALKEVRGELEEENRRLKVHLMDSEGAIQLRDNRIEILSGATRELQGVRQENQRLLCELSDRQELLGRGPEGRVMERKRMIKQVRSLRTENVSLRERLEAAQEREIAQRQRVAKLSSLKTEVENGSVREKELKTEVKRLKERIRVLSEEKSLRGGAVVVPAGFPLGNFGKQRCIEEADREKEREREKGYFDSDPVLKGGKRDPDPPVLYRHPFAPPHLHLATGSFRAALLAEGVLPPEHVETAGPERQVFPPGHFLGETPDTDGRRDADYVQPLASSMTVELEQLRELLQMCRLPD